MKLFFDTNVIISGSITRGYSFEVIKDAIYKHEVYYTEYLLKEIKEVLLSKYSFSDSIRQATLSIMKKYFIKGKTAGIVKKICRDSDDNQILADALANGIEFLITGDKDLLVLKEYQGMKIILPKQYWSL